LIKKFLSVCKKYCQKTAGGGFFDSLYIVQKLLEWVLTKMGVHIFLVHLWEFLPLCFQHVDTVYSLVS